MPTNDLVIITEQGFAGLVPGPVSAQGGAGARKPRQGQAVRHLLRQPDGNGGDDDPCHGRFQPAHPGQRRVVRGAVPAAIHLA